MSTSSLSFNQPQTQIRLWRPGGDEPAAEPDTLCQFYRSWYREIRLSKVTDKTQLVYEDAIRWYETLSGDPPWWEMTPKFFLAYSEQLQSAKYRRGTYGYLRPLAKATYNKLLNHLLAVVKAAIRKGYLHDDFEYSLPSSGYKPRPGDRFSVAEMQQLYAKSFELNGPKGKLPVPLFWQLFLSMAFYIGERRGTILALRAIHIEHRDDGPWWVIPDEIVSKTSKGDTKPVHPFLAELVGRAPNLLAGYKGDQIGRHFRRLQDLCGIDRKKLHAIRATHSQTLGELGLHMAEGLAQATLQHSSVKVTRDHYVDLRNQLLRKFPNLA